MPDSTVVPVLHYRSVPEAVTWLCSTFGFSERLRIGDHRSQLTVAGGGSVVVAEGSTTAAGVTVPTHSIMVRVSDVDRHYERAKAAGARVLGSPATHPYGERQYSAVDIGGHAWTFSQTVASVEPRSWGGVLVGDLPDAV
jgi:uncharacterized glyoxalase superfamily protein PhnB